MLQVSLKSLYFFFHSQKGKKPFRSLRNLKTDLDRSDCGRRLEHCNGLRREAEGRTPLICVWKAILHKHARARCPHELLKFLKLDIGRIMEYFFACGIFGSIKACTCLFCPHLLLPLKFISTEPKLEIMVCLFRLYWYNAWFQSNVTAFMSQLSDMLPL